MFYNKKTLLTLVSFFFMAIVSYFYYLHSVSYSFVDEFDNIVAAHFMIQGKVLFTSIFHNRQIGPVYISYLIQQILHPATLYQLILYHRLFIVALSFAMALLISWRFGLAGMLTVLIFETIKLSSFGNLFQAEAMIVYPSLYLFGLLIESMNGKKMSHLEIVVAGLLSWFIIFSRETYIPLTFLLTLIIFRYQKSGKLRSLLIIIPMTLSILTLLTISINDYLYQVFYVNSQVKSFHGEVNFLKSFFYPIYLFFPVGNLSYTRILELLFSLIFLVLLLWESVHFKKLRRTLVIIIVLGVACLRAISPGAELYSAYKMLVWYALFFYSVFYLTLKLFKEKQSYYLKILSSSLLIIAVGYAIFTSNLFFGKIDKGREFDIAYNRYYVNGEVINAISKPGDTLFVDGYDSLLYWQAHTPPSFKYVIYYPILQGIQPYDEERLTMFREHPPTFYFRDCISANNLNLPIFIKNQYMNFKQNNKPTCLYVLKSKHPIVKQMEKVLNDRFGYSLD